MCCRLSFRQEQFFYLKIRLVVHVVVASVGERFGIIWENANGATYNWYWKCFSFHGISCRQHLILPYIRLSTYVKVKRPYVESTPITRIGISNVPKTKSPTPGGMFASLIGKANRLARMMLKENEAKTAAKKEKKRNEISFIIGSRVADFVKVGETWLFRQRKYEIYSSWRRYFHNKAEKHVWM